MGLKSFFEDKITEQYKQQFLRDISLLNLNRGILLTRVVIFIEVILFLANWYFSGKPIAAFYNFQSLDYGVMYLLNILVSSVFLRFFVWTRKRMETRALPWIHIQAQIISYITFIMAWAAVISLLDQRLYGSVAAYLAALLIGSMIFCLSARILSIPYLISLSIMSIGLPYFQPSSSVLIGHYVNIGIFVILSWVMTHMLYSNYMETFSSRWEIDNKNNQLNEINEQLSQEITLRKKIQKELETANQGLKQLSLKDELTGIPNRRHLENFLNSEWNRAIREGNSISLMMIDIDYFKAFNDNYGHLAGDQCLIDVAQTINACCRRSTDFAARLGGEEFLFVAINISEEGARHVAENIRLSIEGLKIPHEYSPVGPYLTVSIGIAIGNPSIHDKPLDSINRADRALYNAKLAGRNRVGYC